MLDTSFGYRIIAGMTRYFCGSFTLHWRSSSSNISFSSRIKHWVPNLFVFSFVCFFVAVTTRPIVWCYAFHHTRVRQALGCRCLRVQDCFGFLISHANEVLFRLVYKPDHMPSFLYLLCCCRCSCVAFVRRTWLWQKWTNIWTGGSRLLSLEWCTNFCSKCYWFRSQWARGSLQLYPRIAQRGRCFLSRTLWASTSFWDTGSAGFYLYAAALSLQLFYFISSCRKYAFPLHDIHYALIDFVRAVHFFLRQDMLWIRSTYTNCGQY